MVAEQLPDGPDHSEPEQEDDIPAQIVINHTVNLFVNIELAEAQPAPGFDQPPAQPVAEPAQPATEPVPRTARAGVPQSRIDRASAAGVQASLVIAGVQDRVDSTPPLPDLRNRVYVLLRPAAGLHPLTRGTTKTWGAIAPYVRVLGSRQLDPKAVFHGFPSCTEALAYYRVVEPTSVLLPLSPFQ
jgi:hypothetical protein